MARLLPPSALRALCEPATLQFRSTAELPPPDGMIGQERAVAATAFGIAMRDGTPPAGRDMTCPRTT